MWCERHDLALAPDGTCVLCRREFGRAEGGNRRTSRVPLLLAILGIAVAPLLILLILPAPSAAPRPRRVIQGWGGGRVSPTEPAFGDPSGGPSPSSSITTPGPP